MSKTKPLNGGGTHLACRVETSAGNSGLLQILGCFIVSLEAAVAPTPKFFGIVR